MGKKNNFSDFRPNIWYLKPEEPGPTDVVEDSPQNKKTKKHQPTNLKR